MPDITQVAFQDEIMNGFAAFWGERTQISSPNKEFDREKVPAADATFIEWSISGDPDGQQRFSHSVERNHFSRQGVIVFTANVRSLLRLKPALADLDQCLHFLEAYHLDNAIFRNIGTPVDLGNDGAWHQVSVSADWVYFTDRSSIATSAA
jgi:hypothetical protein